MNRYLLDTHVFLWWIGDNPKLSENIRNIISNRNNELYLSTASIWELMIKSKLKKLILPDDPKEFIQQQITLNSVNVLNITMDHTIEIYNLPDIHKDPFDRMMVSQAKIEGLTIITMDSFIKQYNVTCIG